MRFTDFTGGELLDLKHALEEHADGSGAASNSPAMLEEIADEFADRDYADYTEPFDDES